LAAKCLQGGHNPRNNFIFGALIWVEGHIRIRPGGFHVANILIVDDDPSVQRIIRLLLERAGHHVTVAGDGRKGLALFEGSQFDLLFLDIFMPGMDGLETMRHVRALQPAIPIIVISGRSVTPDVYAEPDFLKMATKLGAVASLQKPFRVDALLATVDRCLKAGEPEGSDVSTGRR
jgi:CheY-like chemotaxis protein